LDLSRIDHIIEKGQDKRVEMYSAFADPFETHVNKSGLEALLKSADITDVFCVGLAMDYCVKFTALDATKAGFKTWVISEGTKAVDPSHWDEVVEFLRSEGVQIVKVDEKEVDAVRAHYSQSHREMRYELQNGFG
jgi:nicotinamidase-related amidase